jgi:hypothetical protein
MNVSERRPRPQHPRTGRHILADATRFRADPIVPCAIAFSTTAHIPTGRSTSGRRNRAGRTGKNR